MRGCLSSKNIFCLLLFLFVNLFAQNNPGPRYGHTMVSFNNNIYLFGGTTTVLGKSSSGARLEVELNDLYVYVDSEKAWEMMHIQNSPPARKNHTANVWNGKMIVYGGENETETYNDLWSFDFTTKVWTQLTVGGNSPEVSGHSAVIDGDLLVIAGGADSMNTSQESVLSIDLNNPQQGFQEKADLTEPLQGGGMFLYNSSYYFIGGIWDDWDSSTPGSQPSYSANIWQLGTGSSSWNQSSYTGNLPEISKFAGAYDSENNKYYIVGGESYDYNSSTPVTKNSILVINPINQTTTEADTVNIGIQMAAVVLGKDSSNMNKINLGKVSSVNANTTYLYIYGGLSEDDEVLSSFYKYNPETKTLTEIVLPTAPTSPTNLTATFISSSQINLSWTDNSNDEVGFKIEEKINANGTWIAKDSVAANAIEYQSVGLSSNTKYYYRVTAYNNAGESSASNEINATTLDVIPTAPTNLTATSVSSSQINLNWTDNSNNELGFIVQRKTGVSGTWTSVDSSSAAAYENTELSPNTEYYYRVAAYNAVGESSFSNEANATTQNTAQTIPTAPSNLTATAVSSSQVNLSWIDNSSNETNFKIERKIDHSDFTVLITVNSNIATYSDNDLIDGTNYTYRIFAINTAGSSEYSNETSCITPLNSPTELSASNNGANSVLLNWKDNSQNEAGFKIERKTLLMIYYQIADVSENSTSYADTNFSGSGEFCYRVIAYNDIINSEYSDEAWITVTNITDENILPKEFVLHQNYPNPFNPTTTIRYQIPVSGFVSLKLYDLLGRECISLINEEKPAGYYEVELNGSELSTGIYFYELRCDKFSQIKKLVLLK